MIGKSSVNLFTLTIVMLVLSLSGCQRYGSVSDEAYSIANALVSVCNLQDAERLEKVKEMLQNDTDLAANEKAWLEEIVSLAESQRWEQASERARTMMQEQVELKSG